VFFTVGYFHPSPVFAGRTMLEQLNRFRSNYRLLPPSLVRKYYSWVNVMMVKNTLAYFGMELINAVAGFM